VTDDLYNCLLVVSQGYRFVYQPFAFALIPTPSMDSAREIARRRRIVARSLNGIRLMGSLLNPLRHGRFAVGLFVNKLLRRMLPLFLVLLLIATAMEAVDHPWILALGLLQLGLYSLAAIHPLLGEHSRLRPASGLAYYFCLGNYATLLGLLDYLRGRRPERWETRRAALSDSDVRSSVNVWRNSRR